MLLFRRLGGAATGMFVMVAAHHAAMADTPFAWRFGGGSEREANAAIFSSNALTTGSRAIDYHPVLTLSCTAGGDPAWRQSITVRDSLSGSGASDVSVRLDGGPEVKESWALGFRNRSLVLDGEAGLARLLGAKRLRVSWRVGLFSGDAEAVFILSGIDEAVSTLADRCGIAVPAN